tara:strand:- start:104 stop:382 length:279 start_codon:yes stop_codon:yes gene_type:complete
MLRLVLLYGQHHNHHPGEEQGSSLRIVTVLLLGRFKVDLLVHLQHLLQPVHIMLAFSYQVNRKHQVLKLGTPMLGFGRKAHQVIAMHAVFIT